jgi:hypothetical protein
MARDRDGGGERGAVDPAGALDVEEPGGEGGAGRAAGDEGVRVARATERAAWTIDASGLLRNARTGSAAFAMDSGASTISMPGVPSTSDRSASPGPNRRIRIPPAAASAAPAATSAGPRSAPLASTATVTVIAGAGS